ncbi:hypothetical protein U8C40_13475 [Sinorhizobium medicae]|uniref:hypothetical protein n=1 Tax=Sinorhizobium medicae TaxID=110321 RepID=UPI002AF6C2E6|nr:hypothetical protein [Sinorhizobium medicae]WQO64176.1 hypothetical protein U8C40_13475 [Sinorhizobium medicae]WQO74049.1 hypothetical protein U8C31_07165 [Sinorhizobium medicae]
MARKPIKSFTAADAFKAWLSGNGATVVVNPDEYMNSGPGAIISYDSFLTPDLLKALDQPIGTTIDIRKTTSVYHYVASAFTGNYFTAAYVWGKSSYSLKAEVTVVGPQTYQIKGNIRPFDENFDFQVNHLVEAPFKIVAEYLTNWLGARPGKPYEIIFRGGVGRPVDATFTEDDYWRQLDGPIRMPDSNPIPLSEALDVSRNPFDTQYSQPDAALIDGTAQTLSTPYVGDPATAPATKPVDAPFEKITLSPVQSPAVDFPLNPVSPSPLVDIIDQNPQKPTSLNPNKSQKSTKGNKQFGGNGNRDKEDGYSRTNTSSSDHNGGSKSSTGGTSSKSSTYGGKSGGYSSKSGSGSKNGSKNGGYASTPKNGPTPSSRPSRGGVSVSSADGTMKSSNWRDPVLLDLTGNGLAVDPLSSSSFFVDLDGSGYLHRMASAGAGTGMLVLDIGGDGKISDASEFVFTEWDKSATGDLEAIRNVFDTNGNGRLDAGDARWSEFKVLVDGTMVTLDLARHRLDRPDPEG